MLIPPGPAIAFSYFATAFAFSIAVCLAFLAQFFLTRVLQFSELDVSVPIY
jgi:hypothetical protein